MKLFSLRLTTLKSKLYAIVFASFLVRVVVFFALPNTGSNFGPDETNYAGLTEWIAQSKPADQYYPYGSLYITSRSLILPASILNRAGISGIDSVRITSSLYSFLTLMLLTFFILYLNHSRLDVAKFILSNEKKVLSLFMVFAFLPSHLIWSFLGLRESALEFWVVIVFALVFYIFELNKKASKATLFCIGIFIPLVFYSRPQIGWLLGITLLTYSLIRIKLKVAKILIPLILISISLGYIGTTAFSFESTKSLNAQAKAGSLNVSTQSEYEASKLCRESGSKVEFDGVEYICVLKKESGITGLKNPGSLIIEQADAIPLRNEKNQVGAASAIRTLQCPNGGESRFDKYFCITYRAPYTTFTFLFRPMPGSDVTSTSSLFAALENVLWLAAFSFVLMMLIRNRRLAFFSALVPSLLFFCFYSIAAGAYEGNMGTAFRHKSLILWVVLLLIASTIVATQQRKAQQQGISGSSQE